jgi:hypothetical protein
MELFGNSSNVFAVGYTKEILVKGITLSKLLAPSTDVIHHPKDTRSPISTPSYNSMSLKGFLISIHKKILNGIIRTTIFKD